MARAYGEIAVDAAHAQHMTSHIYVALGLWDDMTSANVTALRVESAKEGEGSRSREAWHHRYWLHYGRLQQGKLDEARKMLRAARERIGNEPLPREQDYYGAMYARYLIDTESWDEADQWLAPESVDMQIPHYWFVRSFAAARLGRTDDARELMARIEPGSNANPEITLSQQEVDILKLQVETAIALRAGEKAKAAELAGHAAEIQASLPFRYGPPRISKPTAELLGDVLAEMGEDEQAIAAYRDQLTRSQLRTNSLLGLARASARTGDDVTSREAYAALTDIWHGADATHPMLEEVRSNTR